VDCSGGEEINEETGFNRKAGALLQLLRSQVKAAFWFSIQSLRVNLILRNELSVPDGDCDPRGRRAAAAAALPPAVIFPCELRQGSSRSVNALHVNVTERVACVQGGWLAAQQLLQLGTCRVECSCSNAPCRQGSQTSRSIQTHEGR